MSNQPQLTAAQHRALLAETRQVIEERGQYRPQITPKAKALGRIIWFTLRRNGFRAADILSQREGFKFLLDPENICLGPDTAEPSYYRRGQDTAHCGKAMRQIHACLRNSFVPVLGEPGTELCMKVYRDTIRENPLIRVIHFTCPPEHLLRQLHQKTLSSP